ncbi:MAG TPA: hypothetical protein VF341_02460 [Anaeromyxobacteraceae bacterium]
MPKPLHAQPTRPLSQAERLARRDFLKSDAAKLERQMRDVQEQLSRLLEACEHTDANGRSSIVGGRTKVCAHCGHIVAGHTDKLWG